VPKRKVGAEQWPSIQERKEQKKRIDKYSERKIRMKKRDDISILKPLTNSDSPSTKSKGERFDSAKQRTRRKGRERGEKMTSERDLGPKRAKAENQ